MNQPYKFFSVSLLVTHYNRSKSLERLLSSFKLLNCEFEDVIVSDDGSKPEQLEHIEYLKSIYNFKLITTPKNKGLGNNINKGQDAVTTPYTLYIQEDFVPKPAFPKNFANALSIMQEDTKWDMITLYSYSDYPYMKPYKHGFSEKVFNYSPLYSNNLKFYLYGDHPHLRRSNFLQKFGRYKEGINGDETEMQMSFSFIRNKGKCLFYDDHYGLLIQENSEEEPSTATFRKQIKIRKNIFYKLAKVLYTKFKFIKLNYQLITRN